MKDNSLKASDIEKVTLGILKAGFPIVVEPRELKYSPSTVAEAQFSMLFGAAVAVLYGKAGLDEYAEANLRSPEVKAMMERVACVPDPALDKVYPRQWPASVEIVTRDSRKFSTRIDYPKGDPENPLSWEELLAKFNGLSSPVFSEEKREDIISRVRSLETETNITSLTDLLAV